MNETATKYTGTTEPGLQDTVRAHNGDGAGMFDAATLRADRDADARQTAQEVAAERAAVRAGLTPAAARREWLWQCVGTFRKIARDAEGVVTICLTEIEQSLDEESIERRKPT